MNKRLVLGLSMILLASAGIVTNASAAEKTRAEVRQELIQAEDNGLRFVTDTSYPDVNPIFAQQVAQLKQQQSGTGADTSGSSAAGHREAAGSSTSIIQGRTSPPACVGPVSFCTPYFGS